MDSRDGRYLNCGFRNEILGLRPPPGNLAHNGGHAHGFDIHPLVDDMPTGGFVCLTCTDTDGAPLVVQGSTNHDVVVVLHALPPVAGQIQTQIRFTPPPGYSCVANCSPLFTVAVQVKDLQKLPERAPADGDNYVTLRAGADTHPEGQWATRQTLDTLLEIAEEYRALSDRQLSVNDLSLPGGGLFDWKATYAPPHITHRTGTDADINRTGVDCNVDKPLKQAVAIVAKRRPGVVLVCENTSGKPDPNGPFKHIRFRF